MVRSDLEIIEHLTPNPAVLDEGLGVGALVARFSGGKSGRALVPVPPVAEGSKVRLGLREVEDCVSAASHCGTAGEKPAQFQSRTVKSGWTRVTVRVKLGR